MNAPLPTSREIDRLRSPRAEAVSRARAVITGAGLLTPLGLNVRETWESLLAGGYIRDHAPVPVEISPPEGPRVTALARRAAEEAIRQGGWTAEMVGSDDTALVVGTSKGPIEAWIAPVTPLPGEERVILRPAGLAAGESDGYGLGETAAALARSLYLGRGARETVSAACATGLHALIRATLLIQSGMARRVLVVAAESSLGPLFLGSFRRLGVLASEGCRPFDRHRTGFLMSEGAAAVCLESPEGVGQTGLSRLELSPGARDPFANPLSVGIGGFALGADATHLTGGDRDGLTLRHLLRTVVAGHPVDFVHAHGTGTEINDATELAAIDWVLGESREQGVCPLYSHKGALGHSLGAAGLISVVLSCLVHQTGVVPGNVRTTNPLPAERLRIDNGRITTPKVRRSLAVAAGFGGAAAVLSLIS